LELKDDTSEATDLGDGVIAERLFDDVHILPGLWKIDGYTQLRNGILREFDVKPNVNYFEFPYDWRRDNRVAAHQLDRMCSGWLKTWKARSGNSQAKLIFLAHSMGGLVARYYVECLGGWRNTRKLISFGTPYRGSLKALMLLSGGVSFDGRFGFG